jgi:aryl-alcohol dehydrogenase-like predicted oxidoreductase
MKRRLFLKAASASAVGTVMSTHYWDTIQAALSKDVDRPIPHRLYKDNVKLSIVGFGGIVVVGQLQTDANLEVARAIDRGVNYFDVAPTYGNGEAEEKLSIALKPYRKRAFLACKTQKRDAAGARTELENSLRVLGTDHFDLYQLHAMSKMEDVDIVLGADGALETFVKAREEGKIRYLGFSAHNEDVALRLIDEFPFDSVLFPINYVCFAQGNFGPRLLKKAKERDVACLALKSLAYTRWAGKEERRANHPKCWYQPISDLEKARLALCFTLSENVTAAIPPGDEKIYRIAETLAARFTPLSPGERESLSASSKGLTPIFQS